MAVEFNLRGSVAGRAKSEPRVPGYAATRSYRWCGPPTSAVATRRPTTMQPRSRSVGLWPRRDVCAGLVVDDIVVEDSLEPGLVRDDDVVQALTSDRSNDALDVGVLPPASGVPFERPGCSCRRFWSPGRERLDRDRAGGTRRKALRSLLHAPGRRRMLGEDAWHEPTLLKNAGKLHRRNAYGGLSSPSIEKRFVKQHHFARKPIVISRSFQGGVAEWTKD